MEEFILFLLSDDVYLYVIFEHQILVMHKIKRTDRACTARDLHSTEPKHSPDLDMDTHVYLQHDSVCH